MDLPDFGDLSLNTAFILDARKRGPPMMIFLSLPARKPDPKAYPASARNSDERAGTKERAQPRVRTLVPPSYTRWPCNSDERVDATKLPPELSLSQAQRRRPAEGRPARDSCPARNTVQCAGRYTQFEIARTPSRHLAPDARGRAGSQILHHACMDQL